MIDVGGVVKDLFPDYASVLIDLSHILIGMVAFRYPIVIALFVIYQIMDIKEDDNIRRDFVFFGVGYALAFVMCKR
jgi:hypothetical protein